MTRFCRITQSPVERERTAPDDELLSLINRYALEPLTAEDVYIRSTYFCNNKIDYYRTRFTDPAVRQNSELVVGGNMMVNHNEGGPLDLPIARFIKGAVVEREGDLWGRGWFYYPRNDDYGEKMERMIRGGWWQQVSLAWWMRSFTNSVDGKPMNESPYYPGQILADGTEVIGIMDDIVEVDEVSLVARGGQIGTSIGARSIPPRQEVSEYLRGVVSDRSFEVGELIGAQRSRVQQEVARQAALDARGPAAQWLDRKRKEAAR